MPKTRRSSAVESSNTDSNPTASIAVGTGTGTGAARRTRARGNAALNRVLEDNPTTITNTTDTTGEQEQEEAGPVAIQQDANPDPTINPIPTSIPAEIQDQQSNLDRKETEQDSAYLSDGSDLSDAPPEQDHKEPELPPTPGPPATPGVSPSRQTFESNDRVGSSASASISTVAPTAAATLEDQPIAPAGKRSGRTRLPTSKEPRTVTQVPDQELKRSVSGSGGGGGGGRRNSRDTKSQSVTPAPTPTNNKHNQNQNENGESIGKSKGKGKKKDEEGESSSSKLKGEDEINKEKDSSIEDSLKAESTSKPPTTEKKIGKIVLKRPNLNRHSNSPSPTPSSIPTKVHQETKSDLGSKIDSIVNDDSIPSKDQDSKLNIDSIKTEMEGNEMKSLDQDVSSSTQPQPQPSNRFDLTDLNEESSDDENVQIKKRKLSSKKSTGSLFQEKVKTKSGRLSTSQFAKVSSRRRRRDDDDDDVAEEIKAEFKSKGKKKALDGDEEMKDDDDDDDDDDGLFGGEEDEDGGSGDDFKDPNSNDTNLKKKSKIYSSGTGKKRNRDDMEDKSKKVQSDISDSEISDQADSSEEEVDKDGKSRKNKRIKGDGKSVSSKGKEVEKKSSSTNISVGKDKEKDKEKDKLKKSTSSTPSSSSLSKLGNQKQPKKTIQDMLGKQLGSSSSSLGSPSTSIGTPTSKTLKTNTPSSSNLKSKLPNFNSNSGNSTPNNTRINKPKGSSNPLSSLLGLEPSTKPSPSSSNISKNEKEEKERLKSEADKAKMRAKLIRDKESGKDKEENKSNGIGSGFRSYAAGGNPSAASSSREGILDHMNENEIKQYRDRYRDKMNDVSDCFDLTVQNDMMKAFELEMKEDFYRHGRLDLRRQHFGTSLQWSSYLTDRESRGEPDL